MNEKFEVKVREFVESVLKGKNITLPPEIEFRKKTKSITDVFLWGTKLFGFQNPDSKVLEGSQKEIFLAWYSRVAYHEIFTLAKNLEEELGGEASFPLSPHFVGGVCEQRFYVNGKEFCAVVPFNSQMNPYIIRR